MDYRLVLVFLLCVGGCSDSGVKRQNLSGKVNFAGSPIPYGKISFRPDREKGGSGPAGFAEIVEGKYSTKKSGKGAIVGPVKVIIEGLSSNKPMAPPLFAPYKTEASVASNTKSLDFNVPEEAGIKSAPEIPAR